MKCNVCNNTDLMRIHQLGVTNRQRIDGPEPEVMFDIMLCPICGSVKIDPETIRKQYNQGIWSAFKLKEL